ARARTGWRSRAGAAAGGRLRGRVAPGRLEAHAPPRAGAGPGELPVRGAHAGSVWPAGGAAAHAAGRGDGRAVRGRRGVAVCPPRAEDRAVVPGDALVGVDGRPADPRLEGAVG